MKNILFIYIFFTLSKAPDVSRFRVNLNNRNNRVTTDSCSIINTLYKNAKTIPYSNEHSFRCKYSYNQKSKIVKVSCIKQINKSRLEYDVELKDTKGVFNKINFNVGDDYKYITSYFMIDGIKLSLNKVHALNSDDDFLTHISNIWSGDKSSPTIKRYTIGKRKVFLIKGINPFCNGHNCSDYVVYILQKENGKGSINAVHFNGTNNPYDFNNFKLFFGPDVVNPAILVPKNNHPVNSQLDLNMYKIYFDGIRR